MLLGKVDLVLAPHLDVMHLLAEPQNLALLHEAPHIRPHQLFLLLELLIFSLLEAHFWVKVCDSLIRQAFKHRQRL